VPSGGRSGSNGFTRLWSIRLNNTKWKGFFTKVFVSLLQNLGEVVDRSAVGKSSLLRPLEEEEDSEEEEEEVSRSSTAASSSSSSKGMGGMFSVFRGLVGNKALSKVRQLLVDIYCKQCCGSGMFIPDPFSVPDPNFFHPVSASKNLSTLTHKIVSKLSEI
jgi:hypothetical protein